MQYMFLICDEEAKQLQPGDPAFDALMADYAAFSEMVSKMGIMRGGERLQPVSTATCVQVRDGSTITTDGPFAETKEQFGGYYLLECKDIDQAIELAAQIPTAKDGTIEVRPCFEMG